MTHLLDQVRQLPDYANGRSDADNDYAAGKLMQRDFGPSPSWWNIVVEELQRQHGISFEFVDISSDGALVARCIGYNERMRELITLKLGQDVVGIAQHAAEELARKHGS